MGQPQNVEDRRLNLRRRDLMALVGGAAVAWPLATLAQQTGTVPRLGVLYPAPSVTGIDAFYEGLHDLGYSEGQNIVIERVYGNWKPEGYPQLAAEVVRRKVDVIVVISTSLARAAKEATGTIPIVVAGMADPVADGLVASLARPGGNLTGNTFLGPELTSKRLGLLKQAIPGLSRVAALWHPTAYGEGTMARIVTETEVAAQKLGVQLQLVPTRSPDDFDGAFAAMTREHADALLASPSPMLFTEHRRIAELAARSRLPSMYAAREYVDAGGLMSYGADIRDLNRRCAIYVDKILKGVKPANLPVEQPTKFDLVINLKTARDLSLVIPPSLLAGADEVIE